jgi:arylsulfatase A-like enzyme/thioredoxin-like negative regulator of GroEL
MRTRLLVALVVVLALAAAAILLRPLPALAPGSPPSGPGAIILVTIDTLRADAVGVYRADSSRPSATPTLDGLAASGVRFDRAYAAAPITLTSHATVLTGLLPPGHGGRHNGMAVASSVSLLAEEFKAVRRQAGGWRTGAFVTAFPLDRRFGLSRGFDTYSDRMPRDASGRLSNERSGAAAVDEAIAWVTEDTQQRPFFLWLHLFEPHAPYGDALDGRPVRVRYQDEVAEADRQVRRLLDGIGVRRDEALVVATADHGEAFGEHGEVAHSLFVYDTTLRVPLIIDGPGLPAGSVVDEAVGLVDLAATIRRLAGLPHMDGDGVDLSPAWRGGRLSRGPLYSESFATLLDFGWSSLRSIRTRDWKFIDAPKPELYDITRDPGEGRNVIDEHPAVGKDFAVRVAAISGPELPESGTGASDSEAVQRLRALGYASGSPQPTAGARRDPKDGRAVAARLAMIASGELSGPKLESALIAVLREDPANAQANLRLGHLRVDQGRCAEAEGLFTRAIRANLPGADAHLGLATCFGARGVVDEALKVLSEANAREPGNPVVLANLGIGLAARQQDAAAIDRLRAALAIDPDLHEARFHLARALARQGRREEAGREARELLQRLPPDARQRAEVERLLRAVS